MKKLTAYFLIIIAFSIITTPLSSAQNYGGVAYTANIPNQPLGIEARSVVNNDAGFFFQIKTSTFPAESQDYSEVISETTSRDFFEDPQTDTKTTYISLNGGTTYGIIDGLHVWGGLGLSYELKYYQFNDPTGILGDNGEYWVESEDGGTVSPNLLVGVGTDFRSESMYGLLGYETTPSGVSFAIGIKFLAFK
jgi:hypothetical protein